LEICLAEPRRKTSSNFFKKYGRLTYVTLKAGFGFVEFDDARDASDAAYELNDRELLGSRVRVEFARRDRRETGSFGAGRDGRDGHRKPFVVNKSRYCLIVENLSSRVSWQDLKSMMRTIGWITFADAHKIRKNEGIVYFENHADLKRAIEKYQGEEVNGRKLKLIDDTRGPSHSPSRSDSRSRSPAPKKRSVRSRSGTRSRSRSPAFKDRSARKRISRSRSYSPVQKKRSIRSSSRSPTFKNRSIRNRITHSRSRSRSPAFKDRYSRKRVSRSPSRSPVAKKLSVRTNSRSPVSKRLSRSPDVKKRLSRSPDVKKRLSRSSRERSISPDSKERAAYRRGSRSPIAKGRSGSRSPI